MSLPLDGSCDGELEVKGLDGLEIGDWRRTAGPETPLESCQEKERLRLQICNFFITDR